MPRAQVITCLIAHLEEAAAKSVKLVMFPETTFATFFPQYLITDEKELDSYFEVKDAKIRIVNSANVKPFFDKAAKMGVDIIIRYGEKNSEGTSYNTASYVSSGRVVLKYGSSTRMFWSVNQPFKDHSDTTNQLEKRYLSPSSELSGHLFFNMNYHFVIEKEITLSGGQRVRIALAQAMYWEAKCILLDDLLAAVDMHTVQHLVENCLSGSFVKGHTIILVTHQIGLCLPITSYIMELSHGKILQKGSVEQFKDQGVLHKVIDTDDQPFASDDNSEPSVTTAMNKAMNSITILSPVNLSSSLEVGNLSKWKLKPKAMSPGGHT
ncbi:P-loop containing nucleoside triphosphate hydrolase protein [Armillaria luteobubalina]|uniref:P-loop containing nucleoside triphosphate hydrolase protein n=1 Tax=Armillaria luteobubalina TaxID=153913 RepID=A0AA39P1T5_9AGAR|nr:P-loop containing nucleoside triphosphate hydrolase protein [Armillaria luteobubalina]